MSKAAIQGVLTQVRHLQASRQTDAELLERFIAGGDETAFAEVVQRHGPKVYAVCRRVLGQHHLAEDAYQATFLVLAKKAPSVQPPSAVGGFLYGVARKAALEARALSRRRKQHFVAQPPDRPSAPVDCAEPDVLAMLDEEIANLSEKNRAAVVLCEIDGVSRAEAARRLGIAEGTLSSRLAAARKQLATRLQARGVTFSAALFTALAGSATAAAPPALAPASATVSAIAAGVIRAMMLAKWKVVTTLCALAAAFTVWSLLPAGAAPAPLAKPDDAGKDGLIWLHESKANRLIAYSPAAEVVRRLSVPEGQTFLGLTPDGSKIVYAAKAGGRLTYHLRELGADTPGTDLGLDYSPHDLPPRWNREGTKFIRRRGEDPKTIRGVRSSVLTYEVLDLGTKATTRIEHPSEHWVMGWAPDQKHFVTMYVGDGNHNGALYLTDGTGEPAPLKRVGDQVLAHSEVVAAGDGRTLLVGGVLRTPPRQPWHHALWKLDVPTGRVTQLIHEEGHGYTEAFWSPDGSRLCMMWGYVKDPNSSDGWDEQRLTVAKADGADRKTITLRNKAKGEPPTGLALVGWFPARAARRQGDATEPKQPRESTLVVTRANQEKRHQVAELLDPAGKSLGDVRVGELSNAMQPRLSPDGKRLAFLRQRPLKSTEVKGEKWFAVELYVVDLDGKKRPGAPLLVNLRCASIAWSPDGKRLYVSAIPAGKEAIAEQHGQIVPVKTRVLDVATGKEKDLNLPEGHVVCDIASDEKTALTKRIYWHPVDMNCTSYLVPLDTMKPKAITTDENGFEVARFSPDGTRVAGLREEFTKSKVKGLFVYHLATTRITAVPLPREIAPEKLDHLAWAPDGKRLAILWRGATGRRGGLPGAGADMAEYAHRISTLDTKGEDVKLIREYKAEVWIYALDWASVVLPENARLRRKPDPEAEAMVRQLGSDDFQEREAAHKKLRAMGGKAISAVKAGLKSGDLEVVRRCKALLPELIRADLMRADHPAWERFADIVGDGKAGRALYVEMIDDPRRASRIHAAEDDPDKAHEQYEAELKSRVDAISEGQRQAEHRNRHLTGLNLPDSGIMKRGEYLTLLFLGCYPGGVTYREQGQHDSVCHFNLFSLSTPKALRETNDPSNPALRRLYAAWLNRREQDRPLDIGLYLALSTANPECLSVARRLAADVQLAPRLRGLAVLVVGQVGTKDDAGLLEGCLADSRVFHTGNYTHQGGKQEVMETLVGDAALAAQLKLYGGHPGDHGYPVFAWLNRKPEDFLVQYYLLGFSTAAAREKAHANALAFLKAAKNR